MDTKKTNKLLGRNWSTESLPIAKWAILQRAVPSFRIALKSAEAFDPDCVSLHAPKRLKVEIHN